MSRKLLTDWLAGQVTTWTVIRGKCRYDRHESVRMVDGQWWGESSRGFECFLAPQDPCPVCDGKGYIEIQLSEAELAQFDGPADAAAATRQSCGPCGGGGYVPGPHWPYRHDCPPPLKIRS
jgi:hypothetical protein